MLNFSSLSLKKMSLTQKAKETAEACKAHEAHNNSEIPAYRA